MTTKGLEPTDLLRILGLRANNKNTMICIKAGVAAHASARSWEIILVCRSLLRHDVSLPVRVNYSAS